MKQKVIIALAGVSLAGKDTLAEPLLKVGFLKGSFASNLKKLSQEIFNLPPVLTDTQEGKKKRLEVPRRLTNQSLKEIVRWMGKTHNLNHKATAISAVREKFIIQPTLKTGKTTEFTTARELLQVIGTDVCREIVPNYHIDVLINEIKNSPHQKWIITDCRFPDEREALKSLGAITVLIKRPSLNSQVSNHISENSLGIDDDYDIIVINDGTIDELQEKAKAFIKL